MTGLWLLASLASATLSPVYRSDLSSQASYFCHATGQLEDRRPLADAQIELAFVQDGVARDALAKDFARENGHRGYGHGLCPDGRPWIVSTPAPKAVLREENGSFRIDRTALAACRGSSIDTIRVGKTLPESSPQGASIDGRDVTAIAVSCQPRDKPEAGPELWALVNRRLETIEGLKTPDDLQRWINARRGAEKLGALQPLPALDALASEAARNQSLEHPHAFLMKRKAEFRRLGLALVGENRAMSRDVSGLATLFWNSPQHRSLLLNAKANAIGYAIQDVNGQKHLVLILAQK